MRPGFTPLFDQNGTAFVLESRVIGVTGQFAKGRGPVSRRLILEGTPTQVYILNSAENAEALGFTAEEWETDGEAPEPEPAPPPKRRGRGPGFRRAKAPTVAKDWEPPHGDRPQSAKG